ncbi:MAG: DUF1501 domain-containing protein [Phycisphaerales bacterium]|nr:DUF1501 domain-containing protein [Phycisphaerales bacterium]
MADKLFTSRREFLAGGVTFLSAASTLPVFLGRTATALASMEPRAKKRDDAPILVVVQLAGGNDGLNTIVPVEMDEYYRARPRLAIKKANTLALKDGVALPSECDGLKGLFDEGRMAVIQGVGYPNPNRSHFVSMDVWHTADPDLKAHNGWLGRYFDSCCNGADPSPSDGVAIMSEAPLAMQGEKFMPLSFESPDALRWRSGERDKAAAETFRKLNNLDGDKPLIEAADEDDLASYLQRAALQAQVGADEIRSAAGDLGSGRFNRRTGGLGRSLQMVARLIAADLPTRIYYVSMGGFDTHTGQEGRHRNLMTEFSSAMKAFIDQLAEDKLLERVVVMSFSEFGRRVEENSSGGTDHGEAAPMFLFGSRIAPGLHGKHPSLTNLHRGDLEFGVDFRRVYAGVLRDWLKQKPEQIIGRQAPLRLIA